MLDLRKEEQKKEQKAFMNSFKRSKKFTWATFFKWSKYASLSLLAYLLIFEPVWLGQLIGRWIHDFFGEMIKEINK